METLSFSFNWNNKLDCNYFTTIRIYNPNKYYPGNQFNLELKNKIIGKVEVIQSYYLKLDQLTELTARLDTGYSLEETKNILTKMYSKVDFTEKFLHLIMLKKIKE